VRLCRVRRVDYTTSPEYETELKSGGVCVSLFTARESGVLMKGKGDSKSASVLGKAAAMSLAQGCA